MTFRRLLSSIIVSLCWLFVSVAQDVETNSTAAHKAAVSNSSQGNSTAAGGITTRRGNLSSFGVDGPTMQRALYVLIGFTMIGGVYFLIRAVRMKKPGQKKKYGLLSNYDDSVEMDAVESDEDDTLYEARSLRSSR